MSPEPVMGGALAGRIRVSLGEEVASGELERARTLCELCRFGEAAAAVSAIISGEPRNWQAWCLMARAQIGQEQRAAGLQAALAAASLAPDQALPRRLESLALNELARHEEAAEAAAQAVRIDPDEWRNHAELAQSLSHLKSRLDEAAQAARRAVELAPRRAEPYMAAGSVALAAGDREGAAELYARALAMDPQNGAAHNELVRLRRGRTRLPRLPLPRLGRLPRIRLRRQADS